MKRIPLILAFGAIGLLAGCEKPKPRPAVPADVLAPLPDAAGGGTTGGVPTGPMALSVGRTPPPAPPPTAPITESLTVVPGMAGFTVDFIGLAQDPLNKRPAVIAVDQPVTVGGFGFDATRKVAAKGLDLWIDGKAYGTTYGAPRPDVGAYLKAPAAIPSGFSVTFPPGTFAKGTHSLMVRVALADGKTAQNGAAIPFTVQ